MGSVSGPWGSGRGLSWEEPRGRWGSISQSVESFRPDCRLGLLGIVLWVSSPSGPPHEPLCARVRPSEALRGASVLSSWSWLLERRGFAPPFQEAWLGFWWQHWAEAVDLPQEPPRDPPGRKGGNCPWCTGSDRVRSVIQKEGAGHSVEVALPERGTTSRETREWTGGSWCRPELRQGPEFGEDQRGAVVSTVLRRKPAGMPELAPRGPGPFGHQQESALCYQETIG